MDPIYISSLSTFLIITLTYWFMPYVTPKTIVFGIRIPPERENDPHIADLRRDYHLLLGAGSVLIFLFALVLPAYYSLSIITLSSFLIEIIFGFLNYYRINRKLEHVKTFEGWYRDLKEAVAAVYTEEDLKKKSWEPLLSMIPSIAIIVMTIYVGIITYPSLPNPFPTHFGANGQPNGYSTKSITSAFILVFIQIGITAMMYFIGYAISRTREEIDVSRPLKTLIQQDRFKHYTRTSLYLFQALINATMMFSSFNIWQVIDTRYVLFFTLIPVLTGSMILTVVLMNMGQMGSRLDVQVKDQPTGVVNRNDDQYWKAGTIYYNKNDSSILVGKRFGVGWTFNFGHPVTWVIMGAIIASAILPVLLIAFHHL